MGNKSNEQFNDGKKSFLKLLQENYGWIAAVLAAISFVISQFLKFLLYLHSDAFFNYYGISRSFFTYDDTGLICDLFQGMLLFLSFCFVCFCYIDLFKISKKTLTIKEKFSNLLNDLAIIIITNFFIRVTIFKYISSNSVGYVSLIATEIIMSLIVCNLSKTKDIKNKSDMYCYIEELKMYFISLPIMLLLWILSVYFFEYYSISNNKGFYMVNKGQVVIYTSKEFYIVSECKVTDDNIIIIEKGTQTKIDNKNIKVYFKEYGKAKLNKVNYSQ